MLAVQLNELLQGYDSAHALSAPRVLLSILASFVLGAILSALYRAYYRGAEPAERSVGRSFVLLTPAVAMIFNLVQFSLPLSLGLLGAMSFVRFRTPIKRAEDIGFILVMIGVGLSCAVGFFVGGVMLLVIVGLVVVLRGFAPRLLGFSASTLPLLTLRSPELLSFPQLTALIEPFGRPSMVSTQHVEDRHAVVLTVRGHHPTRHAELVQALSQALGPGVTIDVYFPDNQLAE